MSERSSAAADDPPVVGALARGDQRALARAITAIENRAPGYRDLLGACHRRAGTARTVGVTGPPGSGKSTLVNGLVGALRERGERVAVVAVDPSSPFSGGAVLGDRVRMDAAVGDSGVFVRSLSARGSLGGLSPAAGDAVTAMDAAGADWVIVETVGAGQNEVDIARLADTVLVLVPPGSGDDVQMLKAGLLEIGDCFVVNKADREGADRTAMELEGVLAVEDGAWNPPVVKTVATEGEGIEALLETLDEHWAHLEASGELADRRRERYATALETLLTDELAAVVESEIERLGGRDALAERIAARETDPHALAAELLESLGTTLDAEVEE